MKENGFDLDLFLKCAKEYGGEIRSAKPGEGCIYVKGKKVSAEEIFSDLEKEEKELNYDVLQKMEGHFRIT